MDLIQHTDSPPHYLKVSKIYTAIAVASLSGMVVSSNLIMREMGLRMILTISSGLVM